MKIKIVYFFILSIILTSCGNRPVKTELPGIQKITLQLNGKKYDELYLSTILPDHFVNTKIFAGQSEDGYKWVFTIPDSIIEMVNYYHIRTRPFDFNTNTAYSASFKGLTKDDSSYYDYVYDEKNPILEATYIDTKLYPGVKGNYSLVSDTLCLDGVSRNDDLFSVDFKKRNTELELSMKYRYFSFMDMDNYEIALAERDSISSKYPDSKYLMSQFYSICSSFKNIDDAKKIYDNFSEESKSTWFGKESGNYIANYNKLYSSGFENVLLINSATEISEPIIRDSTKFTLVIFSASWCGHCHKIIPKLIDIYKDLNGKLEMVYISLDQSKTVNDWKKLVKEKSIPWRSLITVGRVKEMEDKYDAGSIPHMLLVYPDKSVKKIDIRQKEDKEMLYQLVKHEK